MASFDPLPLVHEPSDGQLDLIEFLDLSPERVRDLEVDILATLVGALDRGERELGMMEIARATDGVCADVLQRLVDIGALTMRDDGFGGLAYA